MKLFFSLLLLLPSLVLFAAEDEVKKLHQIFDEDWEHTMETSPTWASQLGDRRWNDRWPDLSLAAIEREHTRDAQMLERLGKISRDALPPAAKYSLPPRFRSWLGHVRRGGSSWRQSFHRLSGVEAAYCLRRL